ncbi:MAG: hypothetical protein ACQEVA_06020 [Myxococcota bacterium]
MNKLALAALASLLLAGCGFIDENIHMSDEELEAKMSLGSGSIGLSGRGHSSGCGIGGHGGGHAHYHRNAYYNIDTSHIRLRMPPAARDPEAVGGIEPQDAVSAVEIDAPPTPTVEPVPKHIKTWGQMVEWHFRQAQQRGEVDSRTETALRVMRD